MLRHFVNFLLFYFPPSRLFALRRTLLRLASIKVAPTASFCGRSWIYGRGEVSIGEGTWISPEATFYTHSDAHIKIGSQCDIGPSVKFIIGSHVIGKSSRRAGNGIARPITIGDGVWIGAGVIILDGVTIGNGCVIAAGSVVRNDMEADCLVAGIPAIVKRKLTDS